MPSFSVRCIFLWEPRPEQTRKHLYEERITLWGATDIDEAIVLAEGEAHAYALESEVEYLGYCQAYAMFDEIDANGEEVFSLLRESDFPSSEYIDAFFDSGGEHERSV